MIQNGICLSVFSLVFYLPKLAHDLHNHYPNTALDDDGVFALTSVPQLVNG
jgi:hypothetical protein